MSRLRKLTVVLVLILLAIQLVPVTRANPPVEGEIRAPREVANVLRRSCYDCHSYETRWPWYAYVAPLSWIVAGHVKEARENLNFSVWASYDAEEIADLLEEIREEVEKGKMPLRWYVPFHPDARLSEREKETLRGWTYAAAPASEGNASPELLAE